MSSSDLCYRDSDDDRNDGYHCETSRDLAANNRQHDYKSNDGDDQDSSHPLPHVDRELMIYFACNLCDDHSFDSLSAHFDHLWRSHTELQPVGSRLQRVPVRLRPQQFVMCALCGMHNTSSAGEDVEYLTCVHLPLHSPLRRRISTVAAAVNRGEHSSEVATVCDDCCAVFAAPAQLTAHLASSKHSQVTHQCTQCLHVLRGHQAYIAHLAGHYFTCLLSCYFCQSAFDSEAACVAHIKRLHHCNYSVHRCVMCGYSSPLLHDFVTHVRSHAQVVQHLCHVCGLKFTSKASLRDHRLTHTCASFPCGSCGRVFYHPRTLRRHQLNTHDRPQQCVCPDCGRQFVSAYSMKRHRMTHTGLRPHQCDKCGRAYVQRNDLKLHVRRCKFAAASSGAVLVTS